MEKNGFIQLPTEWWHYDYKDWQGYGILNDPLDHVSQNTPPRVLKHVEPDFSEEAQKSKIQGVVILSVVVGTDGMPHDITVVQGLGHGLDEKAVAAVKQWRFEPGKKDGKAVQATVRMEVTFHLY
jgi:protein TonB